LGINTFCGENIRQIDGKIEIEVGPVSYDEYLKFLPDQAESIKLKRLLASWLSPTLGVDLRIILRKDDIQPIQLSSTMTIGLSQGAFLMPMQTEHNHETCYTLMGMGHA
jgi:type VI secretion system protein ImpH